MLWSTGGLLNGEGGQLPGGAFMLSPKCQMYGMLKVRQPELLKGFRLSTPASLGYVLHPRSFASATDHS